VLPDSLTSPHGTHPENLGNTQAIYVGVRAGAIATGLSTGARNLLIRARCRVEPGQPRRPRSKCPHALALLLKQRRSDPMTARAALSARRAHSSAWPCGIMDQYISIFGAERAAVEIDAHA